MLKKPGVAPRRAAALLPPLLLFLAAVAVFWPATGNGFLLYDDDVYATANVWVREGVSWAGLHWAFASFHAANWHPLTWLSHMLDASLFGMQPFGHHLSSVVLHAASAAALFVFLRRSTGALWRSLLAGALFALHPLRVESVAWIAERKDVLCTLFWMFSLVAYAAYVRRPAARRYLVVFGLFALALLAKPMALTLPFVLLLIDYWPFGRWRPRAAAGSAAAARPAIRGLLVEKIPLVVLAGASAFVTFLAQQRSGAVGSLEHYSVAVRLANALMTYVGYLGQMFLPLDLAAVYSHTRELPGLWPAAGALAIFGGITAAAFAFRRRGAPAFTVGWFWFLGTLLPVLGLVQVGVQARADRYTYLPSVGIAVALCWGAAGFARRRGSAVLLRWGAAAALIALSLATRAQIAWWRDERTLFEHAIAVSPKNWAAHFTLGAILKEQGFDAEAQPHFAAMKAIKHEFSRAHGGKDIEDPPPDPATQALFTPSGVPVPEPARAAYRQGNELVRDGHYAEAVERFAAAEQLAPGFVQAINNRGVARAGLGDRGGAAADFRAAARLSPDSPEPLVNLGGILLLQGDAPGAEEQYRRAAALEPGSVAAHLNLGDALLAQGKRYRARFEYREALLLAPGNGEAGSKLREASATVPIPPARGGAPASGTTKYQLFP